MFNFPLDFDNLYFSTNALNLGDIPALENWQNLRPYLARSTFGFHYRFPIICPIICMA